MPDIVDFEHDRINLELAGADKLGAPGVSLRYLDDGRVDVFLNEDIGRIADVRRRDASGRLLESIQITTGNANGGLTGRASNRDGIGRPIELEEIKSSQVGAKSITDTSLKEPNGRLIQSVHVETAPAGNGRTVSDSVVRNQFGRTESTTRLVMTEANNRIVASVVSKDQNGNPFQLKDLTIVQAQKDSTGDYLIKNGQGIVMQHLHYKTSQLANDRYVTNAQLTDRLGTLLKTIQIDSVASGNGKRSTNVVIKDRIGNVMENIVIQSATGKTSNSVDVVRKNNLGMPREQLQMQITR